MYLYIDYISRKKGSNMYNDGNINIEKAEMLFFYEQGFMDLEYECNELN